ncbi:MAG: cytochrome c oxidase subunit [Gaiellaceae bacterium]|nr:cytochrome c oxidase subunit [Gaiellaceae bacterium]
MNWIGTTDHKRIGLRVAAYSFVFFVAGGFVALLMRAELARPGLGVVSEHTYNELFTLHGSTMVYLVMVPFSLAFGIYFVPLQVGAADIAAPRLALLGETFILFGGLLVYSSYFTDQGGPQFGWTAFYPLSDAAHSQGVGIDLWISGVFLSTLGSILLAVCILLTDLRLRAPGMTMLRMPVFTWGEVVTCLMVLPAFPVLLLAMVLLFVDRHGWNVFAHQGGPIAYQHLFWFYGHPVVYVMFFPFIAMVGEVIAVFSRRRFFGYSALVVSLLVFAGLSMSVWAHHMFTTGQIANKYFALTSTALVVPAGVEYFDLIATMWGGRISLRTPMLFAVSFILLFVIGGVSGIITASPPLDYHMHNSFFIVAHFHYTLFAGSLFGLFAGLYYWWPKVFGWLLGEPLGKVHFWLLFVGTNLTFFPMFILGYEGMQRRTADYRNVSDLASLNTLSSAGAALIAVSMLVFAANVVVSARRRVPAGNDPWGGHTLEWWTTSPPPRHNFESLPPIRSYAPLYDRQVGEA